jgi:tetratricopeptide (TPR) repeat protein
LRQDKAKEAIQNFEKSLEVAKTVIDNTDSETGEVYFFISQANYVLGETQKALDFCRKAENTFRAAFIKIDDDEIRGYYPKSIQRIIEAQIIMLENSDRLEEAAKVKLSLDEFKKEFAKYL